MGDFRYYNIRLNDDRTDEELVRLTPSDDGFNYIKADFIHEETRKGKLISEYVFTSGINEEIDRVSSLNTIEKFVNGKWERLDNIRIVH